MKIHTGDIVHIISGKDKGKEGRVIRVLPDKNRVVVEGANMRIRHIKKTPNQAGQRISYEASLHASKVMIVDPKTKKPTRVGYKVDAKTGKKVRIAKKSGEVILHSATAKGEKPLKKDTAAAPKKQESKKKGAATEASTEKQPFWKRGFKGGQTPGADGVPESSTSEAKALPSAHRAQGG